MSHQELNARFEACRHLNMLRRFRDSGVILDAGYDWLSGEIAQMERELYGRELS